MPWPNIPCYEPPTRSADHREICDTECQRCHRLV